MKRLTLFTLFTIVTLSGFSQITRQNESFERIYLIENRVAFVKEIQLKDASTQKSYDILVDWAKENYGKDPFISSIRYDADKKELMAKSRIELILPANPQGIREKMVMRYRIDGFIRDNKCILEITELTYLHENTRDQRLPRIIRSEEFITDSSIKIGDDLQYLRINTKKSTLYFLNELTKDLEKRFGY